MLNITPDYVTQTVAPAAEPVTRTEAKLHLRVDVTTDDTLIDSLIQAAREYVEIYTGRAFVRRTYRADIPDFWEQMRLPHKPIISITSIKYFDTASPAALTTLAATNYELSRDVVSRSYGGTWPSINSMTNAVQITYLAGYAPTSSPEVLTESMPESIRSAMLLVIGDLYENREGIVLYPGAIQTNPTVNRLLDQYRVYI